VYEGGGVERKSLGKRRIGGDLTVKGIFKKARKNMRVRALQKKDPRL